MKLEDMYISMIISYWNCPHCKRRYTALENVCLFCMDYKDERDITKKPFFIEPRVIEDNSDVSGNGLLDRLYDEYYE